MRSWFLLAIPLAVACGGERDIVIDVDALVGDAPVACGASYAGIGTTSTEMTLQDLRLYLHDVRVITADGENVPLLLEQDGVWQVDDVVLLDFEDGTSDCTMGNTGTNTSIRGTIPDDVEVVGVRATLGVPAERNHLDVTTAPSPLNFLSMYWGWNGGYKFLRLDGRTTGLEDGFFVHLGSTGCEGDGRGNVTGCAQDNRAEIEVMGFDPDTERLTLDVAALLSDSDMDADGGGAPGCMSGFDDPDCEPIFHALGLPFDGRPPSGAARLFRVSGAE